MADAVVTRLGQGRCRVRAAERRGRGRRCRWRADRLVPRRRLDRACGAWLSRPARSRAGCDRHRPQRASRAERGRRRRAAQLPAPIQGDLRGRGGRAARLTGRHAAAGYPLLVRSLSNVFVPIARNGGGPEAYLITMEQGFHRIAGEADDETFFARVVDRLVPLAESRLVIDNEFVPDLPRELWDGDEQTRSDRARRTAARRARPAARPVADRRDAQRRRAAPREPPLRDRRPELRQRQRAPIRRRLLDERQRRGQEPDARDRTRDPAGDRLRRGARRHPASASRRT